MGKIFEILHNEYWWGGSISCGKEMPFSKDSEIKIDLTKAAFNQHMPFLVSNKGRYIWSDEGIAFEFKDGKIYVEGKNVDIYEAGKTLRDAYLDASKKHFPFDQKEMPEVFFKTAQYNTWMQMTYNPTQDEVLQYARDIVANGFEPGVLMIDEGWHKPYGQWEFDELKFPDPKAMVNELHAMGFVVMLWVSPFVTASGERYIKSLRFGAEFDDLHNTTDLYLRTKDNEVAIVKWWNGTSAILDFTKECDREFLQKQLDCLISEIGVDGFKFDGGQIQHYSTCINGEVNDDKTHFERNIAWNEFGRQYLFHEFKDTYKGGGKCGIQRLMDRYHSWDNEGINTILQYSLVQGLIGSPFICPDMIGGGAWSMFIMGVPFDEELFIRMSQVSAMFPMMQFSLAPWQYLNKENLAICKKMTELHKEMADYIVEKVNESRISGEPIVRHLEYEFPNQGYEMTKDMFMLSEKYLVAPVITKGTTTRKVKLPSGEKWKYVDGTVYKGGQTVEVKSPLEVLPYFERC